MQKSFWFTLLIPLILFTFLWPTVLLGQTQVVMESVPSYYQFKRVPLPTKDDVASKAEYKVLRGKVDPNSAGLQALHNDKMPANEDQPSENFFFAAGTDGGCIEIDLGRAISVKQFASYSWHANTRAAQVYRLYGAVGDEDGLSHTITSTTEFAKSGWRLIASVDTRPESSVGGQHGVSITGTDKPLGRFRYLLLDVSPTETVDAFGNTFFNEIDIYDAQGQTATPIELPKSTKFAFATSDDKYRFTIDTSDAADLRDWCDRELQPVVQAWYPKIVAMLPSDGFVAPSRVELRFQDESRMGGNPAYASGNVIMLNTQWFRRELKREARGAVVHEMVHVVQSYTRNRGNARSTTPGWIVEGIPDYIRWYLYEPESKGAVISERALATATHDASYRVTGNFFDFLTRTYDRDFIVKLNTAARSGRYDSNFWMETFGKSVSELEKEWKADCRLKIDQVKN
jgi:Peptidase of plants and bacteria